MKPSRTPSRPLRPKSRASSGHCEEGLTSMADLRGSNCAENQDLHIDPMPRESGRPTCMLKTIVDPKPEEPEKPEDADYLAEHDMR